MCCNWQSTNKYDGMRDFYEKDGFFIADIWLKNDRK